MAQYFGSDTSAQENDLEAEMDDNDVEAEINDNDVEAEMPGSMADRGMRERRGEGRELQSSHGDVR